MLLEHFGLRHSPFEPADTGGRLVFPGARGEFARLLLGVLARGTGVVTIIGEPGVGKTTMCEWAMRKLPPERYHVVHVTDPTITPRRLDIVLTEKLSLEVTPHDPRQMRARLRDRLNHSVISGEKLVLLFDDAHTAPPETLEHLRMLAQGIGGADNGLRLVLIGPSDLARRLAHESLGPLRKRVAHDLRLQRLGRDDVHDYVHERLRMAGYDGPRIFSMGAIRVLAGISEGIPRRIDLLADQALHAAAVAGAYEIHSRDIAAAGRAIRRETAGPRSPWSRMLSVAASGGFAAGAISATAIAVLAWRLGWIDPQAAENRIGSPTTQRTAGPTAPSAPQTSTSWR
jgi:type II secretory pathway predicted ATPase ExeA